MPTLSSTRSLFHYQRNDFDPEKVTHVHIEAARTASRPIDPHVFGNFLEHLGGVVYQGVWAQVLLNPNLERIEPGDAVPPVWQLTSGAVWQEDGYRSPRCVRLLPAGTAGAAPPSDALAQHIFLPAQRILRYSGALYARTPEGRGQITVTLRRSGAPQALLASAPLTVESADWRRLTFRFMLSSGAVAKGEPIQFGIALANGGPVDVDQITLFPDDNVAGLDPDVLRRAREWRIPLLRYPGGNFASGYHWQDGVGPREARPTRRNPAWGGIEPNHFGTDEFMVFCRHIGAEPQITVNAGDGTPEEAAAWVRYCNAPATDRYGRMRADNGHREPYHVRVWEIGNELYGGWQIGHADAAQNAARFRRFRDALLAADPTLRLIATGKGEEFTPDGRQRNQAWNTRLLCDALANGRPVPDYLSLHPLVPLPSSLRRYPYAEQYESALAQPAFLDATLLPELEAQITAVEGQNPKTRLAVTEWGLIVGGNDWPASPNSDVLAGALFNALTLNTLLRHSDWVTLANMTALMHGGGIKKPRGVVIVDPQYWTQQLYATAGPRTPVAVTTTGPGQYVPARGFLPAITDVPDIDVFAALTANADRLVVFAVNRHRTEPRPLRLAVDGFHARSLSATLLTGPDPQTRNTIEAPDAVSPRPFPTPPWPSRPGADWQVTLPPHTLVIFTLRASR